MRGERSFTHAAYGVGQIAEGLKNTSFELFVFFYYVQVLGLSGTLAGLATFLALLIDAVSDPLVGSLSDRTRHRWGRRHPWIYFSPIPLAVSFVLLFRPPEGLGEIGLFAWLFGFGVFVRIAITLFHVPHMALGAELSDDYGERTTIVAVRTFFGMTGAALASVAGLALFFSATPEFPNGQLNPASYPSFSTAAACGMVAAILLCGAGTHHRIPTLHAAVHDATPVSARLFAQEMRDALANPSFRALFVGVVIFFVTRGVQGALGLHMGTYLWELSKDDIAKLNAAVIAGFLVGLPVWSRVSVRLDKRPTLLVGLAIFSFFTFLPPILWIAGVFPEHGNAGNLPALMAMGFLAAFGGTAALISAGSMMADVTDEHELTMGRRQEGLFFGALAFAGKSASGIGHQVAGLGIDAIGFPHDAVPGDVAHEVLVSLGVLYGPGVLLMALVSFVFISRYRIDRGRHAEILRELDARRAAARAPH
jgi:Na+/melibiose symporter-like transporter